MGSKAEAAQTPVVAEPIETQIVNDSPGQASRFPLRPPEPHNPDDDFRGDEGEDDEDEVESEEQDDGEDDQPRDEQGRFKPKGQTLRDRLAMEARERQAERARADRLEAMLAQQQQLLMQQLGPQEQQPQQPAFGPPNPDDYPAGQFDPQYIAASQQWHAINVLQQYEQYRTEREAHGRMRGYIEAAEAQYAQAVPDYNEAKKTLLADPEIANNPVIGQAIVASRYPVEMMYALGKNPQVAANVARMNPVAASMTLGRIESMIEAKLNEGAGLPGMQQQRQAPAPITPIRGKGEAGNADPTRVKSYAEFVRIREQQENARKSK